MLKLVENKQDLDAKPNQAADPIQPPDFIDGLIAQIKYSHIEEIWTANMNDLLKSIAPHSPRKSHLKAL